MSGFTRFYDTLIMALARIACVMVAAVFVLIVVDVTMRTIGLRPPVFSSAVSEYSLIYITMFAAPWLVRERGHVRIDSFLSKASPASQQLVERILIVVCILICLLAAGISLKFVIEFTITGAIDIRSIEIPRALLFVPLVIGFGLCATEFIRILLRGEVLDKPDDAQTTKPHSEI